MKYINNSGSITRPTREFVQSYHYLVAYRELLDYLYDNNYDLLDSDFLKNELKLDSIQYLDLHIEHIESKIEELTEIIDTSDVEF